MTIQIVGNGEVGIMADISVKELIEEMVQCDPHKIILSGGRGEYRKMVKGKEKQYFKEHMTI